MHGFFTIFGAVVCMALGYWAYDQNLITQERLREAERLERAIASERERLSILAAEWAYLNRPDRLADLVAMNAARMPLAPMAPAQFGEAHQIAYPQGATILTASAEAARP